MILGMFSIVLGAAAAAVPAPKRAAVERQAPIKVAVMELRADGGADPVIARQLAARVAEVAGKHAGSIIAPDDLRALLEQESKKQLLGCTDDQCMSEIAGALGADRLISGRISKIDRGYALSLSLVDAKEAHALAHVSEVWGGESIGLIELVGPMIDELFAAKGTRLTGSILVEGALAGSRILIDDQIRGTAPAGQMDVETGAHKLQVLAEDYEPLERWVVVKRDERASVAVSQVAMASSFYETWWFWSLATLAVGGAVAGTLVLTNGGEEGDGGGQTGVNVSANADTALGGRR